MTGIVNCECSDGDGNGIAPNSEIGATPAINLKSI